MASRKEQKEQARLARLAAEQNAQARAARMRRMQLLGGTLVIAIAAIVVIVVLSSSSGGTAGKGIATNPTKTKALYSQVNSLLAGIPESGTTLGKPTAPVTVSYYGDLQCPFCAQMTLNSLPQFIQNEVRPGKAKIDYRAFCTATCHLSNGQSIFNEQQVAADAAGTENLFWYYTELFYHQQGAEGSGYVTPAFLNGLAAQIPSLNQAKWQSERQNPSLLAQVQQDGQSASSLNLQGTPTLIFKGPKGEEVAPNGASGIPDYGTMVQAMKAVS